jgi:hypothetical protein
VHGLNLLASDRQDDASAFASQLALAAAIGEEFLGQSVSPRGVLYVSLRESPFTVETRLAKQRFGHALPKSAVLHKAFYRPPRVDEIGEILASLRRRIDSYVETIDFMVMDSVPEESDPKPFRQFHDETGISILATITRHLTRTGRDAN